MVVRLALAHERRADRALDFLEGRDACVQEDVAELTLQAPLQRLNEVAVGARQQSVRHLDDGDLRAERGVHGAQLEADVAAAHDEQRLRHFLELECGFRVHDPGRVEAQHLRDRAQGACRHNRVVELDLADLAVAAHPQTVGALEVAASLQVGDTASPRDLTEPARELVDHALLPLAQFREVELRLSEADAPFGRGA